jgi:hypothetical protein
MRASAQINLAGSRKLTVHHHSMKMANSLALITSFAQIFKGKQNETA